MQVDLRGPGGLLEALYEEPAEPSFAAVVCHPHPLHGGTMHNSATYRLARAVRAAGGASLRFNFRGVGRSGGVYGAGQGEADDVRAALDWVAARRADLPRFTCGFSFGAWMALAAGCASGPIRGILAAGLAPGTFDLELVSHCGKPVAVVAHTVKGKGVSFMEDDNNWHYRIPSASDLARAQAELAAPEERTA